MSRMGSKSLPIINVRSLPNSVGAPSSELFEVSRAILQVASSLFPTSCGVIEGLQLSTPDDEVKAVDDQMAILV